MNLSEVVHICIVPVLTVILLFWQTPNLLNKLSVKSVSFIALGVIIMGVSIYDGQDRVFSEEVSKQQIINLQDSLNRVKDTLINIGIGIDEKTGKLLVMDSQLLKKEFTKVFNITYNSQPPVGEISDSENVVTFIRGDSLYISPKKGRWEHAYFAHDTAKRFSLDLNEGMGTAKNVDKIVINNKTYNTHFWKIYDRAVYRASPIILNIEGNKNRYIIFGDEGVPSKRWIYQYGKVTWVPIPED